MTGVISHARDELAEEMTEIRQRLGRQHRTAPAPSFTPRAQSQQAQQARPEVRPVSLATELQRFLSVADEDMIRACNFLLSHPEGAQLVTKAAQVAGFSVPPGTLLSAVAGLDAVLGIIAPQQPAQPQQQPSQPPSDGTGAQPAQQPADRVAVQ